MKQISKVIAFTIVMCSAPLAFAGDDAMKKHCKEMMTMADTNNDGKLSKEEFIAEKTKTFSKYDKDGDGKLSADEYEMMGSDMHKMMMGEKSM